MSRKNDIEMTTIHLRKFFFNPPLSDGLLLRVWCPVSKASLNVD